MQIMKDSSQAEMPSKEPTMKSIDYAESAVGSIFSCEKSTLSVSSKEDESTIVELAERDDVDTFKGWRRNVFRLLPLATCINSFIYFTYLGLRIVCLISYGNKSKRNVGIGWLFVVIELIIAIPNQLYCVWTFLAFKARSRPKLRLTGQDVPTVDVFVTCCGEDLDIILDTVRAACVLDYPQDRYRVVVLDDAGSQAVKDTMADLSSLYPNLHYIARTKTPGVPHHAKAGNLNNGLEEVRRLPGGAGQFMAALDADMIPEEHWLRAVLPHMMRDPKMALAGPPQRFYSMPSSDPLAQGLDFLFEVIEPIKDAMGNAWCSGSGYLARRDALDDIGNIPYGTLAEDVATSSLLQGKGWRTAYIHEPLQFGLMPDDFASHLKQRTRWAIGTVQTSFCLGLSMWSPKVRHMTFIQRFSGCLYALLSLYSIVMMVSFLLIPIILLVGRPLVLYESEEQLRYLICAAFATTISTRIYEFICYLPCGYDNGQRTTRYHIWMAPYIALAAIRSFFLPKWLGGRVQAFKSTGSLASDLNERDPKTRAGLCRRMVAMLFSYNTVFHLLFVLATLAGAAIGVWRVTRDKESSKELMMALLTHVLWPPLTFLFVCTSMLTPIGYALCPPNAEPRENHLIRDPITKVAHPTEESKVVAYGAQAAIFEIQYSTATLYTIAAFVGSFKFL